ncbi:MAG: C4-type zinc ribbon domain-containing protein [Acidobacteriota bacterium]|nr:C4-type zinc ribbon domain-containing protein [Acidobacteriota bacterium]
METDLKTVVSLQEAIDDLRTHQAQLHGIPDWMQELHDRHSERKAEIDALQETLDETQAEQRAAEAETADLQTKLKTFQEQIGLVRNQREYAALLQEIDTVKGHIREAEDKGLSALERQEESQKSLDEELQNFAELDGQYKTELVKWEGQKPQIAERIGELEIEVKTLEERLPKAVLGLFRRILDRHENQALAPIQKLQRAGKGPQMWHCGACNYSVRPQSVVEIANNGSLVPCDSCKRILYLPEV